MKNLGEKSLEFWAQRLALQIANPEFPFVMIMDDSIKGWKGLDIIFFDCSGNLNTGLFEFQIV